MMAFTRDELLTPVKVRGKRSGSQLEKWHTGRSRKPGLRKRPVASEQASKHPSEQSSKLRKRKPKTFEDESPLERLPAEVLQQVFEYSANIELPMVSHELAAKLSKSNHLQHQLTTQLLEPMLGHSASPKELAGATRLLNSRFMTWDFFTTWLRVETTSAQLFEISEGAWDDELIHRAWLAFQPSPYLLPPKKLLSSPFNQEKARFLRILSHNIRDLAGMDATYAELGHEALFGAVRQGQPDVVSLLLGMGLNASTEMLRVAVAESGCDEHIVRILVGDTRPDDDSNNLHARSERQEQAVDLLDPILWSWADEARRRGNEKGQWLVELLKTAQQRRRHSGRESTGDHRRDLPS